MARFAQLPGSAYIIETSNRSAQVPGQMYVKETVTTKHSRGRVVNQGRTGSGGSRGSLVN